MDKQIVFWLDEKYNNQRSLEEFKELLSCIAASAEISEKGGHFCLTIKYDEGVRKAQGRNAGRKPVPLKRSIRLKELEKWIDVTSAETVAQELGVSRSTLFRKIKEAKEREAEIVM